MFSRQGAKITKETKSGERKTLISTPARPDESLPDILAGGRSDGGREDKGERNASLSVAKKKMPLDTLRVTW